VYLKKKIELKKCSLYIFMGAEKDTEKLLKIINQPIRNFTKHPSGLFLRATFGNPWVKLPRQSPQATYLALLRRLISNFQFAKLP